MRKFEEKYLSLNVKGHLLDLKVPKIMGILNITPDSFFQRSRTLEIAEIQQKVRQYLSEGVDILDIGGCSTRPGFELPSVEEEIRRVELGCRIVREIDPDIPISIDTFRFEVAKKVLEDWDIDIINDISGEWNKDLWKLVADAKKIYVLTLNKNYTGDSDNLISEALTSLSKQVNELHKLGVNDVVIDPGFGFSKSLEQNFQILAHLDEFKRIGCPLMVGVSRKSMIYKTLEISAESSLIGTVVLNTISLMGGADILRVHDVKEAKETIKLFIKTKEALYD